MRGVFDLRDWWCAVCVDSQIKPTPPDTSRSLDFCPTITYTKHVGGIISSFAYSGLEAPVGAHTLVRRSIGREKSALMDRVGSSAELPERKLPAQRLPARNGRARSRWGRSAARGIFFAICVLWGIDGWDRTSRVVGSDPQELRKQASWSWPDAVKVRGQLEQWIDSATSGDSQREAREEAASIVAQRGVFLHEAVMQVAGLCDPGIAKFSAMLRSDWSSETLASLEAQLSSLIANGAIPAWVKPELQLAYARALIHHQFVDEAMQHLQPLSIEATSDPSTWLFSLAVCQHHLLLKQPCEETLARLLERETEIPTRYAITARMMLTDIEPLKENSLDEIARMMNDVERRLALGRAGKKVRDQEQAIIDKLEKMIDQLEQQQQQQQKQQKQRQKNQNQKNQPQQSQNQPMDKTQTGGTQGPGDVDEKDIGDNSGWGNLPPAQRQEALQSITKDLPSHYREVIEAYFKRLANSPSRP